MGIAANGTNFVKMGGVTTPAVVSQNLKPSTPVKKAPTVAPLRTPGAGSNAQTRQMEKAIQQTYKTQKTFGVPGAK